MLNQVAGLRSWPEEQSWVPQGSGPSKVLHTQMAHRCSLELMLKAPFLTQSPFTELARIATSLQGSKVLTCRDNMVSPSFSPLTDFRGHTTMNHRKQAASLLQQCECLHTPAIYPEPKPDLRSVMMVFLPVQGLWEAAENILNTIVLPPSIDDAGGAGISNYDYTQVSMLLLAPDLFQ